MAILSAPPSRVTSWEASNAALSHGNNVLCPCKARERRGHLVFDKLAAHVFANVRFAFTASEHSEFETRDAAVIGCQRACVLLRQRDRVVLDRRRRARDEGERGDGDDDGKKNTDHHDAFRMGDAFMAIIAFMNFDTTIRSDTMQKPSAPKSGPHEFTIFRPNLRTPFTTIDP